MIRREARGAKSQLVCSLRPEPVGDRPAAVGKRAGGAGCGQEHPGGADAGYAGGPENQDHRCSAGAWADRQDTKRRDGDQHRGRVEHVGVDAAGVKHQRVPRDLPADGEGHEDRHAGAGTGFAERGETLPPSARVAPGQPREPCNDGEHRAQAGQRCPPRQTQGSDEREREQRRQRDFHQHDRYFSGRDDDGLGGLPRRGTPKRRDPCGKPNFAVDDVAEVANAGGAV